MMKTAKIFKCGNSQALRLPKEFQLHSHEVEIYKRGEELVVREKPVHLLRAFILLSSMPNDFYVESRQDSLPQERDFE